MRFPCFPRSKIDCSGKKRGSVENTEAIGTKFVHAWFYKCASGRAEKPVDYYILAEINTDMRFLDRQTGRLQTLLSAKRPPVNGAQTHWALPFKRSSQVIYIGIWNRQFPDYPTSGVAVAAKA